MNAFVTLVKSLIILVDNNKVFTLVLAIAAGILAYFSNAGTATAAVLCTLGIRFFASVWRILGKEDPQTRWLFRVLCVGAMLFLSAPLLGIVNSFINEESVWHGFLQTVSTVFGWTGGGIVLLFVLLGVLCFVIVPLWQNIVRRARR